MSTKTKFKIGMSVNYARETNSEDKHSVKMFDHNGNMHRIEQGDAGKIKMLGWVGNNECALVNFDWCQTLVPLDFLVFIPID